MFPATASVCNVVLMRNSELTEGISVLNSKNEVIGSSQVAARKVCVNRMVLDTIHNPVAIKLLVSSLLT